MVSIYFQPTDKELVKNGELTFGQVDSSKFTGQITYV